VRLFVALNLPAAVRDALWRAAEPARALDPPVKWVRPEGLHLTLKFLGDVDDATETAVREALARAAGGGETPRAITLALHGFGAFPDAHRPRVFWAGIEAEPPLELLQHRLERELEPLGFPLEGRPFRPHVTLGRAERDAQPARLAKAAAALEGLEFDAAVPVETVDLMRSTLQRSGAVYDVRHRERLS
jgi:2'-5' RNA ligase